ncbi:MAG TPA: hypothetical protein VF681_09245 [Abditibacteriaceae bacterium]|jgi:hypothetical protein
MIFKNSRTAVALAAFTCTAFLSSASAQTPAPPTTAFQSSSILSVSMPPNARLRLDIDARDEDLLGVVKSFLKGANGRSLWDVLPHTRGVQGSVSNQQPAPAGDIKDVAALQLLSDTDLETILRDIKHLRIVAFETPHTFRNWNERPKKPNLATISYYENAYITREGGRRIVRADFDDTQFLTVGFPNGGFGVVMQMPGAGVVVRADGFPNLEGASPMVMALMVKLAGQIR